MHLNCISWSWRKKAGLGSNQTSEITDTVKKGDKLLFPRQHCKQLAIDKSAKNFALLLF